MYTKTAWFTFMKYQNWLQVLTLLNYNFLSHLFANYMQSQGQQSTFLDNLKTHN